MADADTLMTWNMTVRWSESERDQTVGDVTSLGRSSINHQVSLLAAVVTPTLPCSTTSSSCCSSHVACCLFLWIIGGIINKNNCMWHRKNRAFISGNITLKKHTAKWFSTFIVAMRELSIVAKLIYLLQ